MICNYCKGDKTILTKERDRLGLKHIIDCPLCKGTGEVKDEREISKD